MPGGASDGAYMGFFLPGATQLLVCSASYYRGGGESLVASVCLAFLFYHFYYAEHQGRRKKVPFLWSLV